MDMKSEPSVIVGTVTAFVTALIGLLVAFGLDITEDQKNAILGMTAVLAPIIAAVIIRGKVFSPATVDQMVPPPGDEHPDVDDPKPTRNALAVPPERWGITKIQRRDGSTV